MGRAEAAGAEALFGKGRRTQAVEMAGRCPGTGRGGIPWGCDMLIACFQPPDTKYRMSCLDSCLPTLLWSPGNFFCGS